MVSGAVNTGADTDINGFYEQIGTESGCDKYDLTGDLAGDPATAGDYRLAKKDNLFWATVRNSDNVMRYFKLSFDCNMFQSGYSPCCSQGGSLLVVKVANNGCAEFILPVELSAFSARLAQNAVLLNWETASETNNDGFFIERSFGVEEWETLGFVPGHGNSLQTRQYEFSDESAFSGTAYYRLKQMGFDGRPEYSKVVNISKTGAKGSLSIYPNPVKAHLHFAEDVTGEIIVYNAIGALVLRQSAEGFGQGIDVSALEYGPYILTVIGDDGQVRSTHFAVGR